MSLSAREQQTLDSIEDRLAGSDPKLASLLTIFTRLTSGEKMPVREGIRAASGRAISRHRRQRRRWPGRAGGPVHGSLWLAAGMLLLGLAVVVALAAASVAAYRSGSRGTCSPARVAVCAGQAPAHGLRSTAYTARVAALADHPPA